MAEVDDIIRAAGAGQIDEVRSLLAAEPELVRARTMLGSGAIHAAQLSGHEDMVRLLVASGAGLDIHMAAELGRIGELRARLDRRPGLASAYSASGGLPLTSACYWGQIAAARLLLDRGADPDAATRDPFLQIRPLGAAVATPDIPNPSDDEQTVIELCAVLLDRGADVNGRRKDGLTALHSAGWRGHLKVIAYLLERGADISITGTSGPHAGETPADTARSQGQEAAARLLRA
jgi:ankyrin repeat protein